MFQRKALAFAILLAALSNAATLWWLWPDGFGVDFAVFWRTVNGPASQIYAPTAEPFAYPPTALIWFQPLRLAPFWPSYVLWTMISVAAFWVTSAKLYGIAPTRLAIFSPAILLGLIPGQTSMIAAACLFAAFKLDLAIARGVLLGVAVTLKPQLAFLAPLFLLTCREWRSLAAMAFTVTVIAAVATLVFGIGIWSDWLRSSEAFQQIVSNRGLTASAVSPSSYFARPFSIAVIGVGVGLGLFIALRSRGLGPANRAAAIVAASLISAPYALRYDLVALMPVVAAAILSLDDRKGIVAALSYSAALGPLSIIAALPSIFAWRRSRGSSEAEKSAS
jgi:hypothetical protein